MDRAPAIEASIAPEIWAGVECSVVRVGDRIVDELTLTGHARRPGDLRRLADLGITAVRYPALWERHPDAMAGRFEWASTDLRLETMRALGLRPVLGLLHQGTGRRGELMDPEFPDAFGAYAAAVAERYPWVDAYVPINEPLTTARFAGLYGHWYPHRRDDRSFTTLVLNEARAIRAATRAIRTVRPDALIVTPEDVGETFSTPEVAGQAAFDRERRWLVLDLLAGRVDRTHPLWRWLLDAGVSRRELDDLGADPEPPDVIGVNHYPTSDRFLDHRLDRYPPATHGGNGRQAYADVEAVRVLGDERDSLTAALTATAARFATPVALTEVHLGGEAAQRRAWWWAAVRAADEAIAQGVDVRAVTAWATFGSWEWTSLLTLQQGHYEPGLFDARRQPPEAMALATDVTAAAAGRRLRAPARGWWRSQARLLYPPLDEHGNDLAIPSVRSAA